MANSKAALKRIRTGERNRARNRPYRSMARSFVKKAEMAIRSGDADAAKQAVLNAISMLDRVESKGVIHRNNAARRKSRLMSKFNKMDNAATA